MTKLVAVLSILAALTGPVGAIEVIVNPFVNSPQARCVADYANYLEEMRAYRRCLNRWGPQNWCVKPEPLPPCETLPPRCKAKENWGTCKTES